MSTKNIIITIAVVILAILAIKNYGGNKVTEDSSSNISKDTVLNEGERVVNIDEPQPEDVPGTPTKVVRGKIIEKDDGCFADGICKINIDGTWVVTNQGWYRGPLGSITQELAVGMEVEAYGKVTPEGITLLGSNAYYVRTK